jgi:glycosyltransferase involved in cell wall biosynthesis
MNVVGKSERVAFVIPALNESEAITSVILGVSSYGIAIVVNDGSTDNTEQLALAAGAIVVTHGVNRGYDAALASGLAKALQEGFDFAITVDGDGQHLPSRIEGLLSELLEGADLVVGKRSRFQRFSEKIFALVASALWGISDPLCGMKGFRLSRLMSLRSLCSYRSIGTELVIRGSRSNWRISEVAVDTRDRRGNSRFGDGVYANWLILRALLYGVVFARAYDSA